LRLSETGRGTDLLDPHGLNRHPQCSAHYETDRGAHVLCPAFHSNMVQHIKDTKRYLYEKLRAACLMCPDGEVEIESIRKMLVRAADTGHSMWHNA